MKRPAVKQFGEKGPLFSEGKTKRNFQFGNGTLLMEHKDDITAVDGARHEIMSGKGIASCQTTIKCFDLLEEAGIMTHLIGDWLQPNQMIVEHCDMIAIEVVMRRLASGSYLKRNPSVAEGTRLDPIVVEFFLKDDSRHDPYLTYDLTTGQWLFWDPTKPLSGQESSILESDFHLSPPGTLDHLVAINLVEIAEVGRRVFEVLEKAWAKVGGLLWDIKLEFGFNSYSILVVADVIDCDSWRVTWNGKILSKQPFRDLKVVTPEAMEEIRANYLLAAELVSQW